MMRWLVLISMMLVASFAEGQLPTCTSISVPGGISFGNYTGTLNQPGPTSLTIACPINSPYVIALNAGVGVGATTTTRKMTGPGGATLSYRMFQNSARTTNWGNTISIDTVPGFLTTSPTTIPIYPQAAAGQAPPPGTYTDTITASMPSNGGIQTTFTVTAIVSATCTISASALSFGNYSGVLVNASSALTVTCTNLTTFNIGLSAGTATGATVTTRKMTSPALATLSYTLFRDSPRTQNWGNTVGTDTLLSQGTGVSQMFGVFGQIPAGQLANPAIYTDTIVATITY